MKVVWSTKEVNALGARLELLHEGDYSSGGDWLLKFAEAIREGEWNTHKRTANAIKGKIRLTPKLQKLAQKKLEHCRSMCVEEDETLATFTAPVQEAIRSLRSGHCDRVSLTKQQEAELREMTRKETQIEKSRQRGRTEVDPDAPEVGESRAARPLSNEANRIRKNIRNSQGSHTSQLDSRLSVLRYLFATVWDPSWQQLAQDYARARKYKAEDKMMGVWDGNSFIVHDNWSGGDKNTETDLNGSESLDCNPERMQFIYRVCDVRKQLSVKAFQKLSLSLLSFITDEMFCMRSAKNDSRGEMCEEEATNVRQLIKFGGKPQETWIPRRGEDGVFRTRCSCNTCIGKAETNKSKRRQSTNGCVV
jgi:hypothetical protein